MIAQLSQACIIAFEKMEDAMSHDLEKLQGAWKIVSLEMDGQKMGGAGARMEVLARVSQPAGWARHTPGRSV